MSRQSFLDRAFQRVKPSPVPGYAPPPRELAPGLWQLERRLRMPPAMTLPINTTIVRLASGGLAVISPPVPDAASVASLAALGRVEALVAPNSFHYVFAAAHLSHFPQAELYLAPGLAERVPGLPRATVLGETPPARWAAEIEQTVFGPVGAFAEVAFLHRPSATLVLTDLAFHMRVIDDPWNRIAWRLGGVPPRFGPSRTARLTLLRDPAAARPHLQRIARWDFRRILVGHGAPLENDAPGEYRRAFARYLS
jgi:hypothetical protein